MAKRKGFHLGEKKLPSKRMTLLQVLVEDDDIARLAILEFASKLSRGRMVATIIRMEFARFEAAQAEQEEASREIPAEVAAVLPLAIEETDPVPVVGDAVI